MSPLTLFGLGEPLPMALVFDYELAPRVGRAPQKTKGIPPVSRTCRLDGRTFGADLLGSRGTPPPRSARLLYSRTARITVRHRESDGRLARCAPPRKATMMVRSSSICRVLWWLFAGRESRCSGMAFAVTAAVLSVLLYTPADAGPNAGGTLIWHVDPSLVYTVDTSAYCGLTGIACEDDLGGCPYSFEDDCQSRIAAANPTAPEYDSRFLFFVLAAFGDGSCPRLLEVAFGIGTYHTGPTVLLAYGACGDDETRDGAWPAPGSGTIVRWTVAQTSQLTEVYWIAGYSYEYYVEGDNDYVPLAPHPTQGGRFVDDGFPPQQDPIAGYSTLGFSLHTGTNILPEPRTGACCFGALCTNLTPEDCTDNGGVFSDYDVPCSSMACVGTCCLPDGTCVVESAVVCNDLGGDYRGQDLPCDPNPCIGGCCLPNGECLELTAVDCYAQSGVFSSSGYPCEPGLCPAVGACCFVDRACELLADFACHLQGGVFLGEGSACSSCDGACCQDDGTCFVTDEMTCSVSGEFQGAGSVCDPNPCVGGCCLPEGGCTDLTADQCGDAGGSFLGDGNHCGSGTCPSPGACCFSDQACRLLTEFGCDDASGQFLGEGASCTECEGACCQEDGSCLLVDESTCAGAGGAFEGTGTSCSPNPCSGACCLLDGTCLQSNEPACGGAGGLYQGQDSDCSPTACPQPGACCPGNGVCTFVAEPFCIGSRAEFLGEGVACETVDCEGACCYADGVCTFVFRQICELGYGAFLGREVACDPNPCPQPEPCCLGSGACDFLLPPLCEEASGVPSADCALCPAGGACCLPNGSCRIYTEDACVSRGGMFHGEDIECSPTLCPRSGACCFTQICFYVEEETCIENGGAFLGDGSICGPAVCSSYAACCLFNGQCVVTTEVVCDQYQGLWLQYDGCDPTPCDKVLGACCLADTTCFVGSGIVCADSLGLFIPDEMSCDPLPCDPAVVPPLEGEVDETVDVFPNPSSDVVTIRLGAALLRPGTVSLIDAGGKMVRSVPIEAGVAGRTTIVPLEDTRGRALAAGVYYVKVDAGAVQTTRKIVIAR